MNAVVLLERCRDGHAEIAELEAAIALRLDTLTRCTQQISGTAGGRSGGVNDKLGDVACEIADLEQERDR